MCVFVHSFRNNWTQTRCLQIGWKIPREKLLWPYTHDNQNSEWVQGQIFRTNKHMLQTKSNHYRAGSRPMQSMQMHRSEKMTDAFIGHIFTANNEKQHILRKHKACNAQISIKLSFPRNEYEKYSQIYIWKICSPKTCPSNLTLTFRPLMYKPRCFENCYSTMLKWYVKYNQLRSQIYFSVQV